MYQDVTLLGRLGHDPEARSTNSGRNLASFNLAVSRSWTDGNGERQEKTTWFRIAVWDKQGDIVMRYLKRGSKVLVVGTLEEPRVYTDREGNPRAALDVTARSVTFVDSRDEGGGQGEPARAAAAAAYQGDSSSVDDDVPF